MPRKYNLMICEFPGNSTSHRSTNRWIKQRMKRDWLKDKRIDKLHFWDEADTPISMVRNRAIKLGLALGMDYQLQIDSDMSPDCEPDGRPFWQTSWDWMLKRRAEEETKRTLLAACGKDAAYIEADMMRRYPPATVGAPYCGPPPWENVYVFKWTDYESNCPSLNYTLEQYTRDQVIPYTGIWEVAALPTGLILYDLRLFRTLPPPWFEYEYKDPPHNTVKSSTEDVFQTRNASMLGLPQFCNWDAWAGHIKQKVVGKPKPVLISTVPRAMAQALRTGITEEHKVVMIKRHDDEPGKPAIVPPPIKPESSFTKIVV
jgi:hypothetical protein